MSVLSFAELAQSFGADDIFANATGALARGARVGLVGPNGVGKTTLLRIVAGLETPAEGSLNLAKGTRIGYLPQESTGVSERTVWDEMLTAVAALQAMERQLSELHDAMADPDRYDEAIAAYTPLEAEFERLGGYTYPLRIQQTLQGLGFTEADYHMPIPQLSGGQKTRALLARLLIEQPDLLILDEPTNHLDIAAVEWLENALKGFEGAVLIVSHDRYFLDRVVTHIWEMRADGLEHYRGNYSHYLTQRKARWDQRLQIFETEKARLLNELDYVKRNIAGQNVAQAKGKLRRLSREIVAIERLGIFAVQGKRWSEVGTSMRMLGVAEVEGRIKALQPPRHQLPEFRLGLNTRGRSGDIVLRSSELDIGYPEKHLFRSEPIELRRQECAALIGPNGAGKTTFLRTILSQHPPLSGTVEFGANVHVGYFAQAHEGLEGDQSLLDEIMRTAPQFGVAEARSYLGRFLFSGDDVFRPVSTLSGGERGRLALARLTLSNANLLLLDEPTNHLDIPAQEMLQAVLSDFDGTVLLVSHDRYLIDYLATQIWHIENGRLRVYKGNYESYVATRSAGNGEPKASNNGRDQRRERDKAQRAAEKAARQRAAEIAELEARIEALEHQLRTLTGALEAAGEAQDIDRMRALGRDYERTEAELADAMDQWAEVAGG